MNELSKPAGGNVKQAEDQLKQMERELSRFAATIDGTLRRHFVNRTMQLLCTPGKADRDGNIDKEINEFELSRVGVAIWLLSWGFFYSLFHFEFGIPYSIWISLPFGIMAAYFYQIKIAPELFFMGWDFRLMRMEQVQDGTQYPHLYLSARISAGPTGFGWESWKATNVRPGQLVVSAHNREGNGMAIIYLREGDRLHVSSWARDVYKENAQPPITENIRKLAMEFDKKCDLFIKYDQQRRWLEEQKILRSQKYKNSGGGERDIKEIWQDVALKPEVRDRLISLATHFADGSPAASRGLLLYGPPGTGKTLVAKKLAETMDCAFFPLSLPDLKGKYIGWSGANVKELWAKALAEPRAVIFVDECEGVFGRRGSLEVDRFDEEIVQAFLAEWDGFGKQSTVWVVGATNRRDLLDPAILSRFGEEVEIGLPSDEQRIEILTKQLRLKGASDKLPSRAVELTQGFSGRDLENLAGRIVREHGDKPISNEVLEKFTQSFRKQGSTGTDADARWDRLVLSDKTLKELKTLAGLLQHAESFTQRGINVPKGLLLYGPPGTGKTQIARTLANETGLRFIAATTADIKQGYIGQSGQKVKELFERARESSPCLLFIDELDIVAPVRGASLDYITQEIIGQLLQEIDGVKAQTQRVFVLAATNRPDQIDPAVLSRFTKSIEIPLPDEHGRERLLRVLLKKKPIGFDLNEGARILARRTDGMSGRDLVNLIEYAEQTAVGRAIEEGKPDSVEIRLEDFARG